jgi:hypothetical protein
MLIGGIILGSRLIALLHRAMSYELRGEETEGKSGSAAAACRSVLAGIALNFAVIDRHVL